MNIGPAHAAQVARLYATQRPATPPPVTATPPVSPANTVGGIQQLLAGVVSRPPDFEATTVPRPAAPASLPLYTRAADKIEAEVALRGRTLDVTV